MGVSTAVLCHTCKLRTDDLKDGYYWLSFPISPDSFDATYANIVFINFLYKHKDHDIDWVTSEGEHGWDDYGRYNQDDDT